MINKKHTYKPRPLANSMFVEKEYDVYYLKKNFYNTLACVAVFGNAGFFVFNCKFIIITH